MPAPFPDPCDTTAKRDGSYLTVIYTSRFTYQWARPAVTVDAAVRPSSQPFCSAQFCGALHSRRQQAPRAAQCERLTKSPIPAGRLRRHRHRAAQDPPHQAAKGSICGAPPAPSAPASPQPPPRPTPSSCWSEHLTGDKPRRVSGRSLEDSSTSSSRSRRRRCVSSRRRRASRECGSWRCGGRWMTLCVHQAHCRVLPSARRPQEGVR